MGGSGKTALIVQARMGSTRLPGKILMQLGGYSVLHHTLTRCQKVPGCDVVCCAIPETSENDPLIEEAEKSGTMVLRGAENDVLTRYYDVATKLECQTIVRVTSDCPFIDPKVVGEVMQLFHTTSCDFACNNYPPTWPHGLDCEVTSYAWLEKAHHEAIEPGLREHVMPFIRTHRDVRIANYASPDATLAKHRWTLDYPEDFAFMKSLCEKLESPLQADMDDILDCLNKNPDIRTVDPSPLQDTRQKMP